MQSYVEIRLPNDFFPFNQVVRGWTIDTPLFC